MTAAFHGVAEETAICTWFVADDPEDATYFPQIGGRSDTPEAKAIYWRCVVAFFASSLAVNAGRRHILFANIPPPSVDGVALEPLLTSWGVEVVRLPIRHRLPRGSVGSWGNQFYIFDVLYELSARPLATRYIILDSDVLWLKPVNALERTIDRVGIAAYEVHYPVGADINGQTHAGMARFLARMGGPNYAVIPYYGGEIYAATHARTERLVSRLEEIWPDVLTQADDAPREEAHLLSILYALEGIDAAAADGFIRRMWTTFSYRDIREGDRDLMLWHVPAEKRTGFREVFDRIVAIRGGMPSEPATARAMGLDPTSFGRAMGVPHRRPGKFVRDLAFKLREKTRRA